MSKPLDPGGAALTVGEQSMVDAALGIGLVTEAAATSSVRNLGNGVDFGSCDGGLREDVATFLEETQQLLARLVNNSDSMAVTMAMAAQDFTGLDLQAAAALWKPLS